MPSIDKVLKDLEFSEAKFVHGRASIADLFPPDNRCGIYVLHFLGDEFYCGQSVDVTRRFVEHKKVHADIEKISFKEVSRATLDSVEVFVIRKLESQGFRLRNITLTSFLYGPTDLDLIIPLEDQKRWLDKMDYNDCSGTRMNDPSLRLKYRAKYERFSSLDYAPEIIGFLREYVLFGIPAPLRTEVSFWSCSCLPNSTKKEIETLVRVNIFWQEVLTIFRYKSIMMYSFHTTRIRGVARKIIEWRYQSRLRDHQYEPGGQDQINLEVAKTKNAFALIKDKTVRQAVRVFNMRLMRKGACNFGRYHCLELADQIMPQPK